MLLQSTQILPFRPRHVERNTRSAIETATLYISRYLLKETEYELRPCLDNRVAASYRLLFIDHSCGTEEEND